MPGPDGLAALGLAYSGRNRTGRVQAWATGVPRDGRYERTSRYDASNSYDLIYRRNFFLQIGSVALGPALGSAIMVLFGRSEWLHFDGSYLLLENRSDEEHVRARLDNIQVPGYNPGVTWENFATSVAVVHAARSTEIRLSARALFTPMWNPVIDAQLGQAGGRAERVGNPTFSWLGFADANANRTFDPMGDRHFLTIGQRLVVHGPGVVGDYQASLAYDVSLVPDGTGGVNGSVAAWSYWVEDGWYHEYVAAIVQPYVALGAEVLDDAIATVPLPAGLNVRDLYYLPGNQTAPPDDGRRRIRTGRAYSDATLVVELGP